MGRVGAVACIVAIIGHHASDGIEARIAACSAAIGKWRGVAFVPPLLVSDMSAHARESRTRYMMPTHSLRIFLKKPADELCDQQRISCANIRCVGSKRVWLKRKNIR
jgi:hypothetical protein